MKSRISSAVASLALGSIIFGTGIVLADTQPATTATPAATETPAREWHHHRGDGQDRQGGNRGEMFARKLNLNADQQQKIKALRDTRVASLKPIREQLKTKKLELKVLYRAATLDKNAILAKMAESDGLKKQLRESKVDFQVAMAGILTPVQRLQLEEMHQKHRHGHHGHHGFSHRGGEWGHHGGYQGSQWGE